jgi:hypothetical protein
MKNRAALLVLATIGVLSAQPDQPAREGTEKDVQVGRLSKTIPKAQEEADRFIWDTFSKRPETGLFLRYSTKDWRKNYDRFSVALVDKAKQQAFEWESLRSCLARLSKEPIAQGSREEVAYLPIGAYRTARDQRQVWVIFCLWEDAIDPSKQVQDFAPPLRDPTPKSRTPAPPMPLNWPTVGHIRMFTYDLSDATLIGFVTCD